MSDWIFPPCHHGAEVHGREASVLGTAQALAALVPALHKQHPSRL